MFVPNISKAHDTQYSERKHLVVAPVRRQMNGHALRIRMLR
jgi:hypothetical protein